MTAPKTPPKAPPPPDDEPDDPVDLPEGQLSLSLGIPVDPATGKCYKSGEIPPGWNEPVP